MYKLYMKVVNGKIKYYSQEGKILKPISNEAFHEVLELLNDSMIERAIDKGSSVEIRLTNGQIIEYDKCQELAELSELLQKENIEYLVQKYPKGYKPRVNRSKSNGIGRRVASLTLAAGIILTGFSAAHAFKKSSKEESETKSTTEQTLTYSTQSEKIAYEIEEPNILEASEESVLELPFEYKPNGKYESTKDYYGDIIDTYCKKYGFTGCENIICSQITQERPLIGEDGICNNPCQLTNFIGVEFSVPIYNENGLTGEVKSFKVTEEMINNIDSNIEVGIAYLRYCVNQSNSLLTGLFCYNQGPFALGLACDYFSLDKNLYMGDENTLEARDLIVKYFEIRKACQYFDQSMDSIKGNIEAQREIVARYKSETAKISVHGDPNYLENVLGYLPHEDRENMTYEYFLGNELKTVEIVNTLEYNRDSGAR